MAKKTLEEIKNTAKVVTAIALTESQKSSIREIIKKNFSGDYEIDFQTEKSIVAGLYIRIADQVIDATFAKKFNDLKERLLA